MFYPHFCFYDNYPLQWPSFCFHTILSAERSTQLAYTTIEQIKKKKKKRNIFINQLSVDIVRCAALDWTKHTLDTL